MLGLLNPLGVPLGRQLTLRARARARARARPARCGRRGAAGRCAPPRAAGSNVVIQSFTPDGVAAAVQKERITDVLLVPTMIQMFVDHPTLGNYDLSSLEADRLRRLGDQRTRC